MKDGQSDPKRRTAAEIVGKALVNKIEEVDALKQRIAELEADVERLKSESSTWRKGFEGLQESFIKQSSDVKRLKELLEKIQWEVLSPDTHYSTSVGTDDLIASALRG